MAPLTSGPTRRYLHHTPGRLRRVRRRIRARVRTVIALYSMPLAYHLGGRVRVQRRDLPLSARGSVRARIRLVRRTRAIPAARWRWRCRFVRPATASPHPEQTDSRPVLIGKDRPSRKAASPGIIVVSGRRRPVNPRSSQRLEASSANSRSAPIEAASSVVNGLNPAESLEFWTHRYRGSRSYTRGQVTAS
jgi:hypothetical protein